MFQKCLTAPPEEDVVAAAKNLLSKQFQDLRVLNSQPPALAKHTKGDLHSIEQISERMLSIPTESSVEFMVAELDDALQSLIFLLKKAEANSGSAALRPPIMNSSGWVRNCISNPLMFC